MRLLIMGPPGAGKGTHAATIAEKYNLSWVSTGNIFRDHIARQTQLGKLAHSYIARGEFVPDEVTNALVKDTLEALDPKEGFLLDGYPRSLEQAQALTASLTEHSLTLDGVIYLDVPKDEVMRRLLKRAEIEAREDDTEPVIKNRLEIFHASTQPLLEYYEQRGILLTVDGLGSVEQVRERVIKSLETVGH